MGFLLSLLLISLVLLLAKLFHIGTRREKNLPPGPPTVPIIGNLHLVPPMDQMHYQLSAWAAEYGGIYLLKIFSINVIVLTSSASVAGILDKRGAVSADRPTRFLPDLLKDDRYLPISSNASDEFRANRKAFQLLTPDVMGQYSSQIQKETHVLLKDLLDEPKAFVQHVTRTTTSSILAIAYGQRITSSSSSFIKYHGRYLHENEQMLGLRGIPVTSLIPWIDRYLPDSLASWRIAARKIKSTQMSIFSDLLDGCQKRLDSVGFPGCHMQKVLQKMDDFGFKSIDAVAYHGGVVLDGGTNNLSTFMCIFILMMVMHPECQDKIHKEMEAAIGNDYSRTPILEDFDKLPYLQCAVKETTRIWPTAPIIPPHRTTDDIEYNGYFIPKDSMIVMNLWGMQRDPDVFDAPDKFRPERYMESEFGTKPGVDITGYRDTFTFGAGRRICPGIKMAGVFKRLVTMNIIWGFEFKPTASSPKSLKDDIYGSGPVCAPRPFSCEILPRNEKVVQLIREAAAAEH